MAISDNGIFDIAVLGVDDARPALCFPRSAINHAESLARELLASRIGSFPLYPGRQSAPLMVTEGGQRWLILRCLQEADGIILVVNIDSPRWSRLDLGRIPMDVLNTDSEDGEAILRQRECLVTDEERTVYDPFGVLSCCVTSNGSADTAVSCICALAEIVGCGVEINCTPDQGLYDVAVDVTAAMALYMLMLCLRVGADRSCRVTVDRWDGEVVLSFDFELCPHQLPSTDGEEWVEMAACRRLADGHNLPFEACVGQGGVSCRFSPACREWSRLGIKLPDILEYD